MNGPLKTYICRKGMLGGEQIISPLKSSVKNDCISSSIARVSKFCMTNKSSIKGCLLLLKVFIIFIYKISNVLVALCEFFCGF